MSIIELSVQTGTASIDLKNVTAIVRSHDLFEETWNLNVHMKSGTIFMCAEYTAEDYENLVRLWTGVVSS
jgi:hypothetical protein